MANLPALCRAVSLPICCISKTLALAMLRLGHTDYLERRIHGGGPARWLGPEYVTTCCQSAGVTAWRPLGLRGRAAAKPFAKPRRAIRTKSWKSRLRPLWHRRICVSIDRMVLATTILPMPTPS